MPFALHTGISQKHAENKHTLALHNPHGNRHLDLVLCMFIHFSGIVKYSFLMSYWTISERFVECTFVAFIDFIHSLAFFTCPTFWFIPYELIIYDNWYRCMTTTTCHGNPYIFFEMGWDQCDVIIRLIHYSCLKLSHVNKSMEEAWSCTPQCKVVTNKFAILRMYPLPSAMFGFWK